MTKPLLKPGAIKIGHDLNGAITIEIVGGNYAALPPNLAIEVGAAILKNAGCNLDFKAPEPSRQVFAQ